MRCTLVERRVSGVVHTRALYAIAREPLQWAAFRDARCASLLVCAWLQSPRALSCCCALPIKERASPASPGSRISTFIARNSAGFRLCLCSSLPLLVSAPRVSALRRLYLLLCLWSASSSHLRPSRLCLASASHSSRTTLIQTQINLKILTRRSLPLIICIPFPLLFWYRLR